MIEFLASWLSTYLLHSTLLLGAAGLLRVALGERRLALQEAALRAALLGGFLTASLQLGLGVRPLAGSLSLGTDPTPPAPVIVHERAPAIARPYPMQDATAPTVHSVPARAVQSPQRVEWPAVLLEWAFGRIASGLRSSGPALVTLWGVLAALALVRLGVAAARLRLLLSGRGPLADRDLTAWARALAARLRVRSVRLSIAPRLMVPLATGIVRPEVCLPGRALTELPSDERVALCAHELAHIARCDPAWTLLARFLEALAPIQPLNLWARRRLRDLAECLSDDLAVEACARPLGLARSLVDVASWSFAQPTLPSVMAAGAVSVRSRLGLRVERLMNPVRVLERPRRLLLPLAAVVVLGLGFVMPVVLASRPVRSVAAADQSVREVPQPPDPPLPAAVPRTRLALPAPEPAFPPTDAQTPPTPPASVAAAEAPLAPEALAAPVAAPSVVAPPVPLVPVLAPHAALPVLAANSAGDSGSELEQLSQRIVERSQQHEAELAEIQGEMEALSANLRPQQRELEKLAQDLEGASADLAEALADDLETGNGPHTESEAAKAARRNVEDLQRKMKEMMKSLRVPQADIRRLSEKARELAEAARPSDEDMQELRRLAERYARESMPDAEEISRSAREAADQSRDEMRNAAREMRKAAKEMRRAAQEAQQAHDEVRESQPQPDDEQ